MGSYLWGDESRCIRLFIGFFGDTTGVRLTAGWRSTMSFLWDPFRKSTIATFGVGGIVRCDCGGRVSTRSVA